jgi:hypothetical protein
MEYGVEMSTSARWPRRGSGVAVLILATALAAFTILLLFSLGGAEDRGDPSRPGGSEYVGLPMFTANRDRVAVCVQAIDVDISESYARDRIEVALADATENPSWERVGLPSAKPRVDVGCPRPPAAFAPDVRAVETGKGLYLDLLPVKQASYYLIFAFVVPPEKRGEIFGTKRPVTTEEIFKLSIHEWSGVTTGLYLTADEVNDREFMVDCLTDAVGLREPDQAAC